MLTYTGTHITRAAGAPTIRDIAVHTMRLPRYGGAGRKVFPVGQHLIVTGDFLPDDIQHHGHLHDAAEALMNDVPYPFKTGSQRALERRLLRRIYESQGIAYPTPAEEQMVHEADVRAMYAESWAGVTPMHFLEVMGWSPVVSDVIRQVAENRIVGFNAVSAMDADGPEVALLERLLQRSISRARRREHDRAA